MDIESHEDDIDDEELNRRYARFGTYEELEEYLLEDEGEDE